jgi:hypothetical protein
MEIDVYCKECLNEVIGTARVIRDGDEFQIVGFRANDKIYPDNKEVCDYCGNKANGFIKLKLIE